MSHIAAIILAAGGSTRLGSPKQLLNYQGQTLLRRATTAALGAGCRPVVVVLGAASDSMRRELADLDVRTAINEQWTCGMGSSIRVGMQTLLRISTDPPQAVLISLCDQPLINADTLRELIGEWSLQTKEICVSTYGNAIGPPVIVGSAFFDALLCLPDAQGAKRLWMENPGCCAFYNCPAGAIDIDTPADVEALRATSMS